MSGARRWIIGGMVLAILGVAGAWGNGLLAPDETKIIEVAPGVFFRKTQTQPVFLGCNNGWIEFRDFVVVIEANFPDQASELIGEIRKRTDKPIRYVFDTHYHGDHADGNPVFVKAGAAPIASENSKILFETKGKAGFEQQQKAKPDLYGKLNYDLPSLYFPSKLVIDDGTQRVEFLHLGHAHTAGDAVAWLPKHGILFTGDACVNGQFNYTGDSNTESWIGVLTQLQQLPVKFVAPGHGELTDGTLLEKQKRYFVDLRQYIQSAVDGGKSLEEIKKNIDLPAYKEWTGKDAKENVENIEHVYGELTGKKKS